MGSTSTRAGGDAALSEALRTMLLSLAGWKSIMAGPSSVIVATHGEYNAPS